MRLPGCTSAPASSGQPKRPQLKYLSELQHAVQHQAGHSVLGSVGSALKVAQWFFEAGFSGRQQSVDMRMCVWFGVCGQALRVEAQFACMYSKA